MDARPSIPLLAPVLAAVVLLVPAMACGDDPFALNFESNPDSALLYSLSRAELNLPSGYDFVNRRALRPESPGSFNQWDVMIDTLGGGLGLLPPGALGFESEARVALIPSGTFEGLQEAPSDSAAYAIREGVPLQEGRVYVVRSRQSVSFFGTLCVFFVKLTPTRVDVARGVVEFRYDGDNSAAGCNNRRLVED